MHELQRLTPAYVRVFFCSHLGVDLQDSDDDQPKAPPLCRTDPTPCMTYNTLAPPSRLLACVMQDKEIGMAGNSDDDQAGRSTQDEPKVRASAALRALCVYAVPRLHGRVLVTP